MVTIATHNGSNVAREHNLRNPRVVSKEAHIRQSGTHETWYDETPRHAYRRLFDDAVKRYNETQRRADRRITADYYKTVCDDAKKHPVYEMIVGIYGKDEFGNNICTSAMGHDILHAFYNEWSVRNPNLEMIGAYYHADEDGEPHLHIDYVPVAHGYKRGMETQTGLVKALNEMDFYTEGRNTAQIQWEARENSRLEQLCLEHGLTVDHPHKQEVKHLETETYKAVQALNQTREQLQQYLTAQRDTQLQLDAINAELDNAEKKKSELLQEYKTAQLKLTRLQESQRVASQSNWSDRLEKFADSIKFNDGTSVLDAFNESERELFHPNDYDYER